MGNEINLTKGKIYPTLLKFAIPFLFTYLLTSIYGTCDLIIVSHNTDNFCISAVSAGASVMNIVTSIIAALTSGGMVLIGQHLGAKKFDTVKEIIGNMYVLFIILGAAITLIMMASPWLLVKLLNLETGAYKDATNYLFVCALGIPFIVGFNVISSCLKGFGNSKYPFIFLLIAASINIALDLLFISVLQMRALGAALATIIAQFSSFTASIIYVKIKNYPIKVGKEDIKINENLTKKTFKVGLPIAIQDGLVLASFAIVMSIINLRGVNASAALGIADKITYYCFAPLSAFGAAMATITSQNLGAGKIDRVKKFALGCIICSGIIAGVFAIICEIIPSQLASIFTSDPEVIQETCLFIRSCALDTFVCIVIFTLNGIYIGSGHTVFAMSQNLIATFLFRLPLCYLFSIIPNTNLFIIGLCYPLSSLTSLIACIIFYYLGKWKKLVGVSYVDQEENKLTI
jgi:putative MATE family efflux protein